MSDLFQQEHSLTDMPISLETSKYTTGDLNAHVKEGRVQLNLSEREFNFFREIIRETRRVIEPWEMPSLVGWTEEEIAALENDMLDFSEKHQIDL